MNLQEIITNLGEPYGVLAESNTYQLSVVARNTDVAVGDLFLLPSGRGGKDRFYIFRTTEYANILNRTIEIGDVARNKLTMPDSYLSEDAIQEKLIELKGTVLGYAEDDNGDWKFLKPRRLPEHLTTVYHVSAENQSSIDAIRELLASQLTREGLYIGELLAGEEALPNVDVYIPPYSLSHHIGVFGRTGSGKSNLMMVILRSVLEYNKVRHEQNLQTPAASFLAIDPHDEFRRWHANSGGADGIRGITNSYTDPERVDLIEPFYYLSAKELGREGLERKALISRADIMPDDLISITEFSEQQIAFSTHQFGLFGESWIGRTILGDTGAVGEDQETIEYMAGTVAAVQRRLGFLHRGNTRIVTNFDPEYGDDYDSLLPQIICALEKGRVLIIDTTLMTELEQFLLTTVIARTLFTLRRAIRSVETVEDLPNAIRSAFGNDEETGQTGLRTLAGELVARLQSNDLPYVVDGNIVSSTDLPYVNVVVEEAPSVLNPQRMKFGSVFRDISRQGRKFGIGLTVVSQQVSEIDSGVLTQINTELVMALGNELERKEAIKNASADMGGFGRELQIMGKGQVIVSASYKDVPLPVQVPDFDNL